MAEDAPISLVDQHCVPCRGGVPPLTVPAQQRLMRALNAVGRGWRIVDDHHLERDYELPDFVTALALTNAIGALAEAEGHHPDILLRWGRVSLTVFTHKIDGLTESDFVLAAKTERVFLARR